ncbi:MAG TPA: CRISPR-associated endonuclease Cas2 [Firmicutes bacterium]|nr:CRISPR-associated endonuclease Cas2 [Bacillota bacterium]
MRYVVSYDITDDKRRRQVARVCEDFGDRVQYSVFECLLDQAQLGDLIAKLSAELDETEDSVRVYPIHRDAEKNVVILGHGELISDETWYII